MPPFVWSLARSFLHHFGVPIIHEPPLFTGYWTVLCGNNMLRCQFNNPIEYKWIFFLNIFFHSNPACIYLKVKYFVMLGVPGTPLDSQAAWSSCRRWDLASPEARAVGRVTSCNLKI